ncbi:MAG: hypothetical protein WBW33_04275, partial [Bryobacteraceae bacterium]
MELLDRYLQAVKTWLPKAQQDDIIKELSDDILSQMEDKESELGRPLTEAEQSAILKHHGHPMLAASRYWPRQHLIGPTVFPIYWFVLKITVAITVGVSFLSCLSVLAGANPAQEVLGVLLRVPAVALSTFAWVTFVFAVLEYGHARFQRLDKWDPASLPRIEKRPTSNRSSGPKPLRELIASAVFFLWWLLVPQFPFLIFGPGEAFLKLSPGVLALHTTILLLLLLPVALQLVNVLRPSPDWLRPVTQLLSKIAALVIISVLMKAGTLVLVSANAPGNLAQIASVVNINISLVLAVISVIIVLQIL